MEAKIVALLLVAVFGALGLDWLNVLPSLAEMLKFLQDNPEPVQSGLITASVLCVVAIYDEKAQAFRSPWFVPRIELALRALGDVFRDPSARASELVKYHRDYVLYKLGSFDDATGHMLPITPEVVCRVTSLSNPDEEK